MRGMGRGEWGERGGDQAKSNLREKKKSKKGECPLKDTLVVYTCAFEFKTLLSRSMCMELRINKHATVYTYVHLHTKR